ncbi:hypothetical protein C7S17_7397 [Burkholderia thailandensis]|nr:hypothetical protein [Burkholderia thailandensis]
MNGRADEYGEAARAMQAAKGRAHAAAQCARPARHAPAQCVSFSVRGVGRGVIEGPSRYKSMIMALSS